MNLSFEDGARSPPTRSPEPLSHPPPIHGPGHAGTSSLPGPETPSRHSLNLHSKKPLAGSSPRNKGGKTSVAAAAAAAAAAATGPVEWWDEERPGSPTTAA
eukprot:2675189-Rhodomonas_salina.1